MSLIRCFTKSQLAVDRQIEKRSISKPIVLIRSETECPD